MGVAPLLGPHEAAKRPSPTKAKPSPCVTRVNNVRYFTEYFVNGRLEYTARLCGREALDQTSLAAIKQIEGSFAKLLPSDQPPAGCE